MPDPLVLDPIQLARIEGVHRGFLYQHLYAASVLMTAEALGANKFVVEADEDLQLHWDVRDLYFQVKTRNRPLQMADIESAVEHFSALRLEHTEHRRSGEPLFCIISNSDPGPELLKKLGGPEWPNDVAFLSPLQGRSMPGLDVSTLPPALASIAELAQAAIDLAGKIPFLQVPADALVWKLAHVVQRASAGETPYESHSFTVEEIQRLYDQLKIQLQQFPDAPNPYRPQADEPKFDGAEAARLIIGVSGSGKTAWASQHAMQSQAAVAYFDVARNPGAGLAPALARELGAQWEFAHHGTLTTVLLPGLSGLDALHALDQFLAQEKLDALVVLDNVQNAHVEEVRRIVEACPFIRFVFLAQPWAGRAEIEALLNIQAETLNGWSIETIAAEVVAHGLTVTPTSSQRLKNLTGGLPLFVKNSAEIIKREYAGSVPDFCEAGETGLHAGITAQEAILTKGFQGLSDLARNTLAILSLSNVPLESDEVLRLVAEVTNSPGAQVATALRDLTVLGMVTRLGHGELVIHDAFRPLAIGARETKGNDFSKLAAKTLKDLLIDSTKRKPSHMRSLMAVRLLPLSGEVESVVSFATDEFFYEYGLAEEFENLLTEVSGNASLSSEDRFWALEAVAFFRLNRGRDPAGAASCLDEMDKLLSDIPESVQGAQRITTKRLVLAGYGGNRDEVETRFTHALEAAEQNDLAERIARYCYAQALFECEEYARASEVILEQVLLYYELLDLDPIRDVFAKNPPDILKSLGEKAKDRDSLKHLADCLALYGFCQKRLGRPAPLQLIHAMKFYQLAFAPSSVVRIGQDVADDLLDILPNPREAKDFLERNVLPAVREYGLLGQLVAIRAHHAVLQAYCGEFEEARAQMAELEAFADGLSDNGRLELQNQIRLVSQIERGEIRLPPRHERLPSGLEVMRGVSVPKVGRNDRCPCGSGLKYKRCHGR